MNIIPRGPVTFSMKHSELLDLLIRDRTEPELELILTCGPVNLEENSISLFFYFDRIPNPMEVSVADGNWENGELTKIEEYREAIRRVCQVLLGKLDYKEIMDLPFTFTPQLKEWFDTQRQTEYLSSITSRSRKHISPPIGYDQDFMTW